MEALRGYFCFRSVIRIKGFQAAVTRYWVAYRLIKTASEELLLPKGLDGSEVNGTVTEAAKYADSLSIPLETSRLAIAEYNL